LIAAAAVSALSPHLRVCDDIVVSVGSQPTALTCRPLEATDTVVILGLILIVGLVTPDFRRVSVAGILELEREVQEQESRIDGLAAKVEMLTVNASSSHATILFSPPLPEGVVISVDEEKLAQKARRLDDLDKSSDGK
jgi:hypothetical protein